MPATVVTVGNFDGVHLGHVALVAAARVAAGSTGRVVALAFDPHPAAVLRPGSAPARLTTFTQRERLLRAVGADVVEALTPAPAFLARSPEEFVAWLRERHAFSAIVEGSDFRFGRDRAGDIDALRRIGATSAAAPFATIVVPPVETALSDQTIVPVRSSVIRWLLERGRVRDAAICLGRPYELECRVVRGDQRGRTIGYPTANLDHGDRLLPADGVYAGSASIGHGENQRTFRAAISVGTKPTFGASERTCEAHLLEFDGRLDDYGWTIRLRFERWLRDQLTFAGLEPLLAQMALDVASTVRASSTGGWRDSK